MAPKKRNMNWALVVVNREDKESQIDQTESIVFGGYGVAPTFACKQNINCKFRKLRQIKENQILLINTNKNKRT